MTNRPYYLDAKLGYMPAIPLPFYETRWAFIHRFICCECGSKFKTEHEYENHYALAHIEGEP